MVPFRFVVGVLALAVPLGAAQDEVRHTGPRRAAGLARHHQGLPHATELIETLSGPWPSYVPHTVDGSSASLSIRQAAIDPIHEAETSVARNSPQKEPTRVPIPEATGPSPEEIGHTTAIADPGVADSPASSSSGLTSGSSAPPVETPSPVSTGSVSADTASPGESGDSLKDWAFSYTIGPNSPMFPLGWVKSSTSSGPTREPGVLGGGGGLDPVSPIPSLASTETPVTSLPSPASSVAAKNGRRQAETASQTSEDLSTLFFRGTGIVVRGEGSFNLFSPGGTSQVLVAQNGTTSFNTSPPQMNDYGLTLGDMDALVTEVTIQSKTEIDKDVTGPLCQNITLAEGGKLTSDKKVSFTKQPTTQGQAVILEPGTTMEVQLPSNTTWIRIFGTTDPSYGKYDAFISTRSTAGLKKTSGNAGRGGVAQAQPQLYYETTLSPLTEIPHNIVLRADGKVGLEFVELCYSTLESPRDMATGMGAGGGGGGKKTNIGAIVGGVVGGIAFLAIIGGLIFWLRRRKRSKDTPAYRTVTAFTGGTSLETGDPMKEADTTPVSTDGSQQLGGTPTHGSDTGLSAAPLLRSGSAGMRPGPSRLPPSGTVAMDEGHSRHGDGDALPTYDNNWTSTATGDVKKPRGFIARRLSESSLASTISTVSADSDDEDKDKHAVDKPGKSR